MILGESTLEYMDKQRSALLNSYSQGMLNSIRKGKIIQASISHDKESWFSPKGQFYISFKENTQSYIYIKCFPMVNGNSVPHLQPE